MNLSTLKEFKPNLIFFSPLSNIVSENIVKNINVFCFTAPLPYGEVEAQFKLNFKGFYKVPVCAIKMTILLIVGQFIFQK